MSDKNQDRAVAARQLSHSEQFRSNLKSGIHKATDTYRNIPQGATPPGWQSIAVKTGISIASAGRDFGKAGYHGMSAMGERMNSYGNPAANLQNAIIQRSIIQGSLQAKQYMKKSNYTPKVNHANPQKTNQPTVSKGIASHQSKTGGQSSSR